MEVFLHAGNVLYVVSYSVRDILTLRVLTVVAILSLIGYYVTSGQWTALAWSVLFTAVNVVQMWRLLLERRPVKLDLEERRLHGLAFSSVDERHFKRVADAGRWETLATGECFIEQNADVTHVRVILEGSAAVEVDGKVAARVGPGQFVGEGAFLSGQPANASVTVDEPLRVLSVPCTALESLLERHADLRTAMQRIISNDLVSKLRGAAKPRPAMSSALPSPS